MDTGGTKERLRTRKFHRDGGETEEGDGVGDEALWRVLGKYLI